MKDAVMTWHPEPNAGGTYQVWDATEEEQIWATRLTPSGWFKDDVLFEFFGDPEDFQAKGCTVKSKSRSQFISYYDYSTNYCNMWNVINTVQMPEGGNALDTATIEVSDCKWAPSDPKTTCMKY